MIRSRSIPAVLSRAAGDGVRAVLPVVALADAHLLPPGGAVEAQGGLVVPADFEEHALRARFPGGLLCVVEQGVCDTSSTGWP